MRTNKKAWLDQSVIDLDRAPKAKANYTHTDHAKRTLAKLAAAKKAKQ